MSVFSRPFKAASELGNGLMGPNITVSGRVTDAATGEYVLGANVLDVEEGKGVSTNNYGFYSITLPSALQN